MGFKDKECQRCSGSRKCCIMPCSVDESICPCLTCLVKSICNQHCQIYLDYMTLAMNNLDETAMVISVYTSGYLDRHKKYYCVSMKSIAKGEFHEQRD